MAIRQDDPIIIAGGGPAGLVLALLLHERGMAVEVFESVAELKPLGVGINLLPHSVRVLASLDLTPLLDGAAIRTSALHYYNKLGQQIWAEPRGLDAGYPFPQYSIHRGRLQLLLLDTVIERLGAACVHLAHTLLSWRDEKDVVRVCFATPSGEVEVSGSGLVAADGINSTARGVLFPDEGPPIYGGRILWRGTTLADPFLDGSTMFMAGHQDCKFVAYPIARQADGRSLINWIAERTEPGYEQNVQDWNRLVDVQKFRDSFAAWNFGWVDVPALIDGARQVFEFPLSDRDPLPCWTHGRMTLIGDAAHPMYPIGSNGASQAILDAEALVDALTTDRGIGNAFAAYEADRRPATAQIVLSNRQNGPEQVMQIAEERAPEGFDDIEQVIPRQELEAIAARYKATAGFSVEAVNQAAAVGPGD
jgi:2-polyprenyl-6-methoxyphenol hydroxylase-like FAD-dependent oxidoreductase